MARDKNVRLMCEAFDDELRRIVADIPGITVVPNLVLKKITDNLLLDLLAWQFHCDFYSPDLSIETKQELILKSLDWHTRKGTPSVVEEIVSTIFSRAKIEEWFEYGGFPYRFRIATEENMPDENTRNKLITAINSVKNTRSYLDALTQLYDYIDEISIEEIIEIRVKTKLSDPVSNGLIKFNGRIKFDGKTLNDKVTAKGLFDGMYKFNGDLAFNGIGRTTPKYNPIPPFKFSSGVVDRMVVNIHGEAISDQADLSESVFIGMRKHRHFNGNYKFDGSIQFDSMILIPLG
ncbi:MAG: phage tail protein I [Treponema sp.]|nr:phage tail protein I [Treponema sp.]